MLYNDDALEESPELLQQLDGANDSDVERPGKVEVVMEHESEEEEKDGGGWVVVETQCKTREEPTKIEESRTGRVKRMYPTLSKHMKVEVLVRQEEVWGMAKMKRLGEEEDKLIRKLDARTARG